MSSFLLPRRAADPRQNHGLRRYSRVVAGCTLLLIFAGGLVTSTGSGLAVPDWPLSYGQLMPRMVGGILYEHGHRMIAGTVALMMAALCFWTWRVEPRRWVRNLAFIAMGSVLAQALLGGLTVIFLLPPAISSAHAGLAEIFLCLTVTLATAFSHGWLNAPPRTTAGTAFPVPLPVLAVFTTGLMFLQVMIGAWMRHIGAGLAIPDFPTAFGGLIPTTFTGPIAIHFAHRVGALCVAVTVIGLCTQVLRRCRADAWLARPAVLLLTMLGVQVTLGATAIWTKLSVLPTTAHVMIGGATVAVSALLTLRLWRRFRLPAAERVPAGTPATAPRPSDARGVTA